MAMDRFLIAPINSGLQTDLRPFLIMDDAFTELQNAYVFRGRVRKRFGSILMGATQANSRLAFSLGNNTNAAMNLPANASGHTPQLAIGQMFTLGSDFFYVYQLGAGVATLSTNAGVSAVIDSVANPNTITFTGGALTQVNWFPALPVMGLTQYESGTINNHPSYAFDTEFAYVFTGGAWARSGTAQWHGTDLNFFWASNWKGIDGTIVMFVTNFNATVGAVEPSATDDPIWTFDGTTWTAHPGSGAAGFFFLPAGGARTASPFIQTARIIVPFKNRLVFLNTIENDNSAGGGTGVATAFTNRARYSINGSPFANNAWYEPNQVDAAGAVAAGAGFIDASTDEQIISAEFIKDRLIVYFERSTWELAYTGNEILPFVWQKINTELGSQSTFSTVPFDKFVLTIGNTGVHACNGANVERIDSKIPDEIFEFQLKNSATSRTCGIRDYFTELVYWAFNADFETSTQKYPNQILVYNYKNDSWALNDDCFTAFGYFEQQTDTTWASSFPDIWEDSDQTWNSGVFESEHRQILAGNPEGWVLIIDPDHARNAPALQITNITYNGDGTLTLEIVNNNLTGSPTINPYDNDYILIENVVGDALTEVILNGNIWSIASTTMNTVTINTFGLLISGTYNGGGTAAHVSNIQIQTKQYNPYLSEGRNVYIQRIDFAVEKTANGEITVDYYPSATNLSMIAAGEATQSIMGTSVLETHPYPINLYPLEQVQQRLWHPVYMQTTGECIQMLLYFSDAQMTSPVIALSDFELDGLILHCSRSSYRLQ